MVVPTSQEESSQQEPPAKTLTLGVPPPDTGETEFCCLSPASRVLLRPSNQRTRPSAPGGVCCPMAHAGLGGLERENLGVRESSTKDRRALGWARLSPLPHHPKSGDKRPTAGLPLPLPRSTECTPTPAAAPDL